VACRHLVTEVGVGDRRVGADAAALADAGRAAQRAALLEHGVGADADAGVDDRGLGAEHGHAVAHVVDEDAAAGERGDLGEIGAVVDAQRQRGVVDDVGGDALSVARAPAARRVGRSRPGIVGRDPAQGVDHRASGKA
jgi:hypothetical protein